MVKIRTTAANEIHFSNANLFTFYHLSVCSQQLFTILSLILKKITVLSMFMRIFLGSLFIMRKIIRSSSSASGRLERYCDVSQSLLDSSAARGGREGGRTFSPPLFFPLTLIRRRSKRPLAELCWTE